MTSHGRLPTLVNESWTSGAGAATSRKPNSVPVALPRPLRVSLLPCLADGFLLGRGDRTALERTDQEDSAQKGWQDLPQRSSSQWAQSSVALFDDLIRPQQERGGIVRPRALAVLRLTTSCTSVRINSGAPFMFGDVQEAVAAYQKELAARAPADTLQRERLELRLRRGWPARRLNGEGT